MVRSLVVHILKWLLTKAEGRRRELERLEAQQDLAEANRMMQSFEIKTALIRRQGFNQGKN